MSINNVPTLDVRPELQQDEKREYYWCPECKEFKDEVRLQYRATVDEWHGYDEDKKCFVFDGSEGPEVYQYIKTRCPECFSDVVHFHYLPLDM